MRIATPAITQYVRQDGTVIPGVAAPLSATAPAASAQRPARLRGGR
jgi:cell division protein FtsL